MSSRGLALMTGAVLNHCRIVQVLGRGGVGEVYPARDAQEPGPESLRGYAAFEKFVRPKG
jgi:hypothetical protein